MYTAQLLYIKFPGKMFIYNYIIIIYTKYIYIYIYIYILQGYYKLIIYSNTIKLRYL